MANGELNEDCEIIYVALTAQTILQLQSIGSTNINLETKKIMHGPLSSMHRFR